MLQTAVDPIQWVRAHLLPEGGVPASSRQTVACPTASAALLPALIARGEVELADRIASWLPAAQRDDGSFGGDTARVVRGLAAALPGHPDLEPVLRRACDGLLGTECSLPALAALRAAGRALDEPRYLDGAERSAAAWLEREPAGDFARAGATTRDFAAAQVALCDLGREDAAAAGMRSLAAFQQDNGAVPAASDVVWVCTRGQLQAAVAWAVLGEHERGMRALRFLEPFVLPSHGLCGSYGPGADDHVDEEIALAAALWLDAEDALAGRDPARVPPAVYDRNLSADAWHDSIAGTARAEGIAASVRSGQAPPWVQPVLDATSPGQSLLELGSGTGALSATLADAGRHCALLDFSRASLALGAEVFERLELTGRFCEADVLAPLPFADRSFDCVWSSGLLEHFDDDEIDRIVAESARLARRAVISLVPNAASLPYRMGKQAQERAGTWPWGREDPKASLRCAFERAGLRRIREWTIAPEHAIEFLEDNALKEAFASFYAGLTAGELADLGQGYLLVTVGEPGTARARRTTRRLAVVPGDPLQAYADKGLPDLTDSFNPEGCFDEVYCLSPHEPKVREMYGMHVIPTSAQEFPGRVRELGIDVVRAYSLPMGLFACADKVEGVPYLVSAPDANPKSCPGALPDADRFLAASGWVESFLRCKGAEQPVTRLPHRVDLSVFGKAIDAVTLELFAARFPGRYRVLHVGRKTRQKNLETVIEALARLGEDYTAIFVGPGDGVPYRDLAQELGIAHRCHFVGALTRRELASFYACADCMCTPSLWEGFGDVFIEAMASGAVVVTSDIPPMNEIIEDGESGLLLRNPRDPARLASVLELACTDHELAARLRAQAPTAAAPFAKPIVDAREREIYENTLRGSRPCRA